MTGKVLIQKRRHQGLTSPSMIFYLIVTCLILFSSSFLQHLIRASKAFISPFIGVPPSNNLALASLLSYYYVPGIFFFMFVGKLSDTLGSPVGIIIFSIINSIGCFLFYIFVMKKYSLLGLKLSIIYYGMGQILMRVPLKRLMISLYEGPNLALALNINHTASHFAGVVAGIVGGYCFSRYATETVFLLISIFSLFSIICGFVLSKTSNKEKRDEGISIFESLKRVFRDTDRIVWFVAIGGFFSDGVMVSMKNIESYFFKILVDLSDDQIITTIGYLKLSNLFGPFISYFMDKYPYRTEQLFGSSLVLSFILVFYSVCAYKSLKVHWAVIGVVTSLFRINMVFFYSSFYPLFGVLFGKEVRGTGIGFIMACNCVAYFFFPQIFEKAGMKSFLIYLVFTLIGVAFSLGALMDNRRKGNIANRMLSK